MKKGIISIIISSLLLLLLIMQNSFAQSVAQLRYEVGMEYFKNKNYSSAIDQFEQVLKLRPYDCKTLNALGQIYKLNKNYYKALTYFQKAVQINRKDIEAHTNIAQTYAWSGDYQEAIKMYQTILKSDSLNVKLRLGLGDAYSWDKKYIDAVLQYNLVLSKYPDNIEAILGLARIAAWSNEFNSSIGYYEQALKLDSTNIQLHKGLAEVLSWAGNTKAAIKQYKQVLEMDPDFAEGYRGLGQVYSWSGRYKSSVSAHQKAIQLQPEEIDNYLGLAQVYRWNKKFKKAKQIYNKALSIEPQNQVILQKLQSLRYESPYWQTEFFMQLKTLLVIFVALILIYFIRRYHKVLGKSSWFRFAFLRLMPVLAFGSFIVSSSSWVLAASYQKEAVLLGEIIEIVAILLLTASFITLLWILRFGRPANKDVVLAIGAHPDDLEFGCGGTILRYREDGCTVIGLTLSNGESGACKGACKNRITEAKNGAKILKLNQLFIMNFKDTQFKKDADKIKQTIEQMITRFQPDIILTHSPDDLHSDHHTVYEATKEAARGPQTVLLYENPNTPSTFTPDYFVDISGTLIEKIDALKKHKTQSGKDYAAPKVVKSMAKFRGTQARIKYAEGFKVLKFIKNHSTKTYKFDSPKLLKTTADAQLVS